MDKKNPRILVVEDNDDDERLIVRAIRRLQQDIDIEIVRDGTAAVERLCTGSHSLPDIVLLDWKLPKLMGGEVLKQVRADSRCKAVVVVAFSSSDRPDDMLECYEFGGNQYVVKPVDYDAFLAAVQSVLITHCQAISDRLKHSVKTTEFARTFSAGSAHLRFRRTIRRRLWIRNAWTHGFAIESDALQVIDDCRKVCREPSKL